MDTAADFFDKRITMKKHLTIIPCSLALLTLMACSNSNDDNVAPVVTPPAPPAPVITSVTLPVTAKQQFPQVSSENVATANIDYNVDDSTLSGSIQLNGVVASAAHIHSGFAGENGDVVVAFEAGDSADILVLPETALDEAMLEVLLDGGLYINIHTDAFPGGEMRAQLIVNDTKVGVFDITPSQQVPQLISPAKGVGYITLNQADDTLLLNATVDIDEAVLAAHIHMGDVGVNGDPIVNLVPSADNAALFTSELQSVEQSVIDTILAGGTYVNMHTEAWPGGELRGQIAPESAAVKSFALDTLQTPAAQYSELSAQGYAMVDSDASTVSVRINFDNFAGVETAQMSYSDDTQQMLSLADDGTHATYTGELSTADIATFNNNEWMMSATNQAGDDIQGQINDEPSSTGFFLDPQSLVAGSSAFNIYFDGASIGTAVINTHIENDVVTIEEITDAVPFGVVETLVVEMDAKTGAALAYQGTGTVAGTESIREVAIDLQWNTNRLTGEADYSQDSVSMLLPAMHVEQLAFFYSLHAMPLAENLEMPFEVFNALDGSLLSRTLQVQGIEDVTVAAGTFETYKVFLAGSSINQIFYVTTEVPRRLVQIGFDVYPITYELQP